MAFKMNGWSAFTKEIDPVTEKEREGSKEFAMNKTKRKIDRSKGLKQDVDEKFAMKKTKTEIDRDDDYIDKRKQYEYKPQSTR